MGRGVARIVKVVEEMPNVDRGVLGQGDGFIIIHMISVLVACHDVTFTVHILLESIIIV
jgi:hypothetical protein